MKKGFLKILICLLTLGLTAMAMRACVVPHLPARWLWQTENPDWQELAIPSLMLQIKVGMRPDEVAQLFGKTNTHLNAYMEGCQCQSYNVNSWYNRGIDVIYTNGVVREVREYD